MDILIINTDEATDRLNFQQEQMALLGLKFERIVAVTPKNADPKDVERIKKLWDWHRAPIKVELLVTLSYIKAWKKVIANNRPSLILEDDVQISGDLPLILQKLDECEIEADYINLEKCENQNMVSKKPIWLTDKIKLFKIYYFRCSSASYVIYPKGAKILLKHAEKFIFPPDILILSPLVKMNRYVVEPAPARQHPKWFKHIEYPKFKFENIKSIWIWGRQRRISIIKIWLKIKYYFQL